MLSKKRHNRLWFLFFTIPALFAFITVVIIPFIIGIGYSFVSWDGLSTNPITFVGFQNYAKIFSDVRFGQSAQHTIVFTIMAVLSINIIGLALALIVTSKLKVNTIARTMFFMPNLIGGLILGYIWKFILSDTFKAIGESMGNSSFFFNWLLQPTSALFGLVVVITWQMAGYVMIIYITGIQSVPEEVMEAATVDGCGPFRKFWKIQFPLIMPSVTICIFYSLSNCFKIYDINLALTNGGPGTSTEMFAMNIFNEIFSYNNFGYGQAKAIVFFFLIALVTITQVSITKKREVQL